MQEKRVGDYLIKDEYFPYFRFYRFFMINIVDFGGCRNISTVDKLIRIKKIIIVKQIMQKKNQNLAHLLLPMK